MIQRVVDFALNKRLLVLAFALLLIAGGGVAFHNLPIVDLIMSIFLLPTFYVWWARPTDHLPPSEESRSVYDENLS